MPYAADGHPAADRLADHHEVGLEPPGARAATRAGAQGVRLVDDEQYAVPAGDLADPVEVAVLGEHDADVGQRRLHQQAGDVALGQPPVERVEVVERDHRRRRRDVDLRTERARPGDDPVAVEHGERLVDRAVVAPVHHRDPRPAGEVAGEAQHEPVGVGGRHRQLPDGQPEPAGQLLADPDSVLRRQHRRDARARLAGDRLGAPAAGRGRSSRRCRRGRGRRTPCRRRRPAARRTRTREDREGARPAGHPRHRHARRAASPRACPASSAERGCRSTKRCSSVARRSARRVRSIMSAI